MPSIETILATIDERKVTLDALRQTLDNKTIKDALRVEFLYESNRIEGNTLTLRETHLVINEGITISGKSLREHLEAINHKEAILWIEDIIAQDVPFSEHGLRQIHALVLHGLDHDHAGQYRRVPVMIAGSAYLPPPPYLLPTLMNDYVYFYTENKATLHPVILAAELHERLVTIHPFIDGNGRTARLVMNLILLQHGYPLAIIGGDYNNRMIYYETLEQAQLAADKSAFHLFIAQQVLANLDRYLQILGQVV